MKRFTRVAHQFVLITHTEEFFVWLTKLHYVFRKFIPLPSDYDKSTFRIVMRDHTKFNLKLSDYMHWHLFANIPDASWKQAIAYCKPGSTILDIGSNCGHFSLKLATHAALNNLEGIHIHAFEPNPAVCAFFRENTKLNSCDVTLHEFAVGAANENRFFQFNESNSGAGSILKKDLPGKIEISLRKLDSVVTELGLQNIAFIKIDVEGFEPEVFNGGWEAIMKFKPALFFEVTPGWYKQNGFDMESILVRLKSLGYRFQLDHENKLLPYTEELALSLFQYNIFAVHEPK